MDGLSEYIIGIDFGHGETAAWIVPITETFEMKYEGEALNIQKGSDADKRKRDSVVYQDKDGNFYLVGREGTTIHPYFKGLYVVGSDDPNAQYYREYIRLVIQAIIKNNPNYIKKSKDGHYNFDLFIACPTSWDFESKMNYQRFFNDALSDMSVRVSFVINESDAAYFTHRPSEINNCVLVIDYGSSTIDYTLIVDGRKVSDDTWSNRKLGASKIEVELKKFFCKKTIIFKTNKNNVYKKVKNLKTQLKKNGEKHIADNIETKITYELRKSKEKTFIDGFFDVNQGKMCPCYVAFSTELANDDYDDICMKGNLRDIITPYVKKVRHEFKSLRTKVNKKLLGRSLDYIILSGGACNMSWVLDAVREIFGSEVYCNIDNNPSYVVAIGIAKYARAQRQAREELLGQLKNLSFENMFKKADTDASNEIIIQEIPRAMAHIRIFKGSYSGERIREETIAFLKRFITVSPQQNEIFRKILNEKLKEQITQILADVIKNKFKKELTEEDKQAITFNIQTDALYFTKENFNPGGTWGIGGLGYNKIADLLNEVWRDDMGHVVITMKKERNRDEFFALIKGFEPRFIKCISSILYAYDKKEIAEKAETIKQITILEAERLFYKLQLFETTYMG